MVQDQPTFATVAPAHFALAVLFGGEAGYHFRLVGALVPSRPVLASAGAGGLAPDDGLPVAGELTPNEGATSGGAFSKARIRAGLSLTDGRRSAHRAPS